MTEPTPARPVPGPPRPGPASGDRRPEATGDGHRSSAGEGASPASALSAATQPTPATGEQPTGSGAFEDLEQRPVAEHVGVFEAEHGRLQRELGTIDSL